MLYISKVSEKVKCEFQKIVRSRSRLQMSPPVLFEQNGKLIISECSLSLAEPAANVGATNQHQRVVGLHFKNKHQSNIIGYRKRVGLA